MIPTKREFLTDELLDLAAEELSPSLAWAALHAAAQDAPYFHRSHADPDVSVTAEQTAMVRSALAAAGVSAWWDAPMDRSDQNAVTGFRAGAARELKRVHRTFDPGNPSRDLRRWVDEAATRVGEGTWWSQPNGRRVVITTRSLEPLTPAVHLISAEDEVGATRALVHRASSIDDTARVYEITSTGDWVHLTETAPLDVTRSRRSNWGSIDPAARWILPNWSALAAHYDAVHLTVNAYLDLSGVPIDCDSGKTMLVGWGADETVWLNKPPVSWQPPRMAYRHDEVRWSTTP